MHAQKLARIPFAGAPRPVRPALCPVRPRAAQKPRPGFFGGVRAQESDKGSLEGYVEVGGVCLQSVPVKPAAHI